MTGPSVSGRGLTSRLCADEGRLRAGLKHIDIMLSRVPCRRSQARRPAADSPISQAQSMSVPMWVSTVRRAPTRATQSSTGRQIGVGPVRAMAQEAADDPGVDAGQRGERRIVQADDIGRIAEAADPQAERWDAAVVLLEQPHLHAGGRRPCRRPSPRAAPAPGGRSPAAPRAGTRSRSAGSARPAWFAWRTPPAAGRRCG